MCFTVWLRQSYSKFCVSLASNRKSSPVKFGAFSKIFIVTSEAGDFGNKRNRKMDENFSRLYNAFFQWNVWLNKNKLYMVAINEEKEKCYWRFRVQLLNHFLPKLHIACIMMRLRKCINIIKVRGMVVQKLSWTSFAFGGRQVRNSIIFKLCFDVDKNITDWRVVETVTSHFRNSLLPLFAHTALNTSRVDCHGWCAAPT